MLAVETSDTIGALLIIACVAIVALADRRATRASATRRADRRRALRFAHHASGCVYCGGDHASWSPCPKG